MALGPPPLADACPWALVLLAMNRECSSGDQPPGRLRLIDFWDMQVQGCVGPHVEMGLVVWEACMLPRSCKVE